MQSSTYQESIFQGQVIRSSLLSVTHDPNDNIFVAGVDTYIEGSSDILVTDEAQEETEVIVMKTQAEADARARARSTHVSY